MNTYRAPNTQDMELGLVFFVLEIKNSLAVEFGKQNVVLLSFVIVCTLRLNKSEGGTFKHFRSPGRGGAL